jgi:hypothetical protein
MIPPTIDPIIPRSVVITNPKWVCMIMLAMAPAINPIIMDQMICSIGMGEVRLVKSGCASDFYQTERPMSNAVWFSILEVQRTVG